MSHNSVVLVSFCYNPGDHAFIAFFYHRTQVWNRVNFSYAETMICGILSRVQWEGSEKNSDSRVQKADTPHKIISERDTVTVPQQGKKGRKSISDSPNSK